MIYLLEGTTKTRLSKKNKEYGPCAAKAPLNSEEFKYEFNRVLQSLQVLMDINLQILKALVLIIINFLVLGYRGRTTVNPNKYY